MYLVGSDFAAAGVVSLAGFVDLDPGPEQETGSHMAGPRQHRLSAWSLGQCAWQHY